MSEGNKYGFDFTGRKVLVVEDNLISFKLMLAVLSQVHIEVEHALNGRDAIDLCNSGHPFDLVLMDMQMPEVNGLEATRQIKHMHPDLPVIATTANTFFEDEVACKEAGCDAFLTKPLKFRQLFEQMQIFFDRQG
jgi:CheY-like chemotaxis protein